MDPSTLRVTLDGQDISTQFKTFTTVEPVPTPADGSFIPLNVVIDPDDSPTFTDVLRRIPAR